VATGHPIGGTPDGIENTGVKNLFHNIVQGIN